MISYVEFHSGNIVKTESNGIVPSRGTRIIIGEKFYYVIHSKISTEHPMSYEVYVSLVKPDFANHSHTVVTGLSTFNSGNQTLEKIKAGLKTSPDGSSQIFTDYADNRQWNRYKIEGEWTAWVEFK